MDPSGLKGLGPTYDGIVDDWAIAGGRWKMETHQSWAHGAGVGAHSVVVAGLGNFGVPTTREECVATVKAAVDAGITLIDLAPRYGDGKAEQVVGEAFGGRLPRASG